MLHVLAAEAAPQAFTLDVLTVARLLGLVVPLLVALLTKKYASDGLKSILNVVLSSVSGVVALTLAGDGDQTIAEFFNAILNTFVTSIIAYYGAYKPTGVAATVADKTSDFGLGSPPEFETDEAGAVSLVVLLVILAILLLLFGLLGVITVRVLLIVLVVLLVLGLLLSNRRTL